jgi:hypothetical protein
LPTFSSINFYLVCSKQAGQKLTLLKQTVSWRQVTPASRAMSNKLSVIAPLPDLPQAGAQSHR